MVVYRWMSASGPYSRLYLMSFGSTCPNNGLVADVVGIALEVRDEEGSGANVLLRTGMDRGGGGENPRCWYRGEV